MTLRNYKPDRIVSVNLEVIIGPTDVAEMFWEMDDNEMVQFFNRLGYIADQFPVGMLKQMVAVAQNKALTAYGAAAIAHIASINEHKAADDHA